MNNDRYVKSSGSAKPLLFGVQQRGKRINRSAMIYIISKKAEEQ